MLQKKMAPWDVLLSIQKALKIEKPVLKVEQGKPIIHFIQTTS